MAGSSEVLFDASAFRNEAITGAVSVEDSIQ
jgi:hypothetical protein